MRLIVGLLLSHASLSSRALPSSCFVTPCPRADLYESRRRSPKQVFVLHQQQHDDDSNGETSQMRRSFLAATAASLAATVTLVTPPVQAAQPRVKGAAEYDLEYYMRDLVKGNTKEGNLAASAPPPAPPSRTLQGPLLPLLLDNEYTDGAFRSGSWLKYRASRRPVLLVWLKNTETSLPRRLRRKHNGRLPMCPINITSTCQRMHCGGPLPS